MKRSILFCVLMCGFAFGAQAQLIAENAIGLRLSDSDGFGVEISYQRAVGGDNNRLELDLGIRDDDYFSAVQIVGIYQWVWNIEGGFNWYAGPGLGLGFYSFDDEYDVFFDDDDPSEVYGFIAGDIGIEYNFDIPLMVSLDFRPEFGFDDVGDDVDFDIGIGVRYQF